MAVWKRAAIVGALVTAAGAGAAFSPRALAQTASRVQVWQDRDASPRAEIWQVFGRGSQLGVTVHDAGLDDSKDSKSTGQGVVIDDVRQDSPADKAGIKSGDVIVEFDGERVRSVRQFTRLVQETPEGRKVQAVLLRSGQRTTVSVAPQRESGFHMEDGGDLLTRLMPALPPAPPTPPPAPRAPMYWASPELRDFSFRVNGGRLGIGVEDLTPQLGEYFGVKDGALVRSVTDGSAAAKAGLKAGDVITAVDGSRVVDASDVSRTISRLDDGVEFTIDVIRDHKPQTLKGKLEKRSGSARSRVMI